MKMSHRAKRMQRHLKRSRGQGLNLVSLMDIFTILVFFLLVNSSTAEQLSGNKDVQLPVSSAEKAPNETLLITITQRDILVGGLKVASVDDVLNSDADVIPGLEKELKFQAGKGIIQAQGEGGREVTIMGDQTIPYKLLKKIMQTSTKAGYSRIALAVTQQTQKNKGS